MSESKMSLEEELSLADIFSDPENETNISIAGTSDETNSMPTENSELNLNCNDPEWKGVSMEEIYGCHGPYGWHHLPQIQPSSSHTILFQLPITNRGPPKPHPSQTADEWSQNCVRMPHSRHSLYPINPENESSGRFRRRWEVIQEALLQNFMSSHQLEKAILSYNYKYAERWNFAALHNFFNDYIDEEEMKMCLGSLIPKMVQLALQLPDLIKGSIPLLKRQTNKSISLSQLQVASLLANAFFCTFPRRNSTNPQSEYAAFPHINFERLFGAFSDKKQSRRQAVMEKLKCIFHYFRRVTTKAPEGIITIQRRYIPKSNCPRWDKQSMKLPPLHITSKGTIESEGRGLLQVDFANKFVGGGVLRYGCVQEEIRFVLCPELMVTMLVAEVLDDTEALIIKGVERYSKYEGYGDNFSWVGDYIDETPRDTSGRMQTCIVAIDALRFNQPKTQFDTGNLIRELNKAYVGFYSDVSSNNLPAVATGNWGCGAFRGNPQLKVLLQLMAAAVAGRSVVYFTFGDTNLRDNVADMYWNLVKDDVDIGRLFILISQYQDAPFKKRPDFYNFLYNRGKMKTITNYFNKEMKSPKKFNPKNITTTEEKLQFNSDFKKYASIAKLKEDELEEKVEKWLEDIREDSTESENKEKEDKKTEVQTVNEGNTTIDINKSDPIKKSNEEVLTTMKELKKKQRFGELFEDECYDPPKRRISSLDTFDKLILEETEKDELKKSESMEIDIQAEKKIKICTNKSDELKFDKSIKINRKDTQTKIDHFFTKKDK